MKKIMSILIVAIVTATSTLVSAQALITPLPDFAAVMNQQCYVITQDGTRLEGKLKFIMGTNGNISSFTIKDEAGEKHKFKPANVKECGFKLGALAKIALLTEQSSSLRKFVKSDFNEMLNREWAVFENANKHTNDKPVLLQLLNPGVDSKLKVYVDPKAKESYAGFAKSYLVVKESTKKSFLVSKKKYKKQFFEVFNDSQTLIDALPEEKIKWSDFAEHVYVYNQL